MNEEINYRKLQEMISRCHWTFAKTMPWAPHEYIVRGKCPLTEEEFLYFVDMQRRFGYLSTGGNIIILISILTIISIGRWECLM